MSGLGMLLFGVVSGLCLGGYAGAGWERRKIDVHYVEKQPDDPFLVSDSARKARLNKTSLVRFKIKSLAMLAIQVVLVLVMLVLVYMVICYAI